ncbi:39S ribosomal protein L46, mitochondrial [Pseudolycoriella hygida]|uniref:Large ribosomal subunit protein mL46 n=1 Tax=Pseudolycoriella hygida TaxID=35572 RepID=A0A9Q0N103_9DIPT|nr:39S ribosomal protein L46, mitochondrial [Pseudolycoriella hygida]
MLKRAVKTFLSHSTSHRVKCAATNAATIDQSNNKWDLYAGVLVERLPVITKSLNKIEQEYLDHLKQLEFEQSSKSDFEMRDEKDKLIAQLSQKGKHDDVDTALQQTAQDLKDAWKDELHQFQLGPRTTEADHKNDVKSTNRKLEETLFLLVEQRLGEEKVMLLPQGKRVNGETMRQTAERVLKENCGDDIDVMFYGNAPCGFYKWKYPSAIRGETVGAKLFFYRASHKKGNVIEKETHFQWLDKVELEEKLPKEYAQSVSQFLL